LYKKKVYKIEEYTFSQGIFETLLTLQKKNFLLIIVTNQSGMREDIIPKKRMRR